MPTTRIFRKQKQHAERQRVLTRIDKMFYSDDLASFDEEPTFEEYDSDREMFSSNSKKRIDAEMMDDWWDKFGEIQVFDLPMRRSRTKSARERNQTRIFDELRKLDAESQRLMSVNNRHFGTIKTMAEKDVESAIAELIDGELFKKHHPNLITATINKRISEILNNLEEMDRVEIRKRAHEERIQQRNLDAFHENFTEACQEICQERCPKRNCHKLRSSYWQPVMTEWQYDLRGPETIPCVGILCYHCNNVCITDLLTMNDVEMFRVVTGINEYNRQPIPANFM